jgi:WS/DGAT/MGAT family acyltransferase
MALMPITDAMFMLPERREQPMHVGSLQLFRLPEGAGVDWVRDTYESMLTSTEVRALFRRRPVRSLRTLGAWAWADDTDVDLEHHVRHSALPRPGRVRELLALASRLHGTLLDRQRPLWEMHVIEGLEDNRFAVYTKIHHSLLDGMSALALLRASLATDPEETVPAVWAPRRAKPAAPDRKGPGLVDVSRSAISTAGQLAGLGPAVGRYALQTVVAQGRQLSSVPPRTMLNVPISGSRRYAAQSWPLDDIKSVGRATGATVNDVVLAMCGSALREYLLSCDALPAESLVAMTPVSLRDASDTSEATGNAVGAILARLATDVADPAERLEQVKASMKLGKDTMAGMSPLQATAMSALVMAPLGLAAMGGLARLSPPPFNLVISNLPGPRRTLYLNGATLEGLYPMSIPTAGQALNITVTSYRGSLDFGLTGDRRALPHLQRLLTHLDTALTDLRAVAGV